MLIKISDSIKESDYPDFVRELYKYGLQLNKTTEIGENEIQWLLFLTKGLEEEGYALMLGHEFTDIGMDVFVINHPYEY